MNDFIKFYLKELKKLICSATGWILIVFIIFSPIFNGVNNAFDYVRTLLITLTVCFIVDVLFVFFFKWRKEVKNKSNKNSV